MPNLFRTERSRMPKECVEVPGGRVKGAGKVARRHDTSLEPKPSWSRKVQRSPRMEHRGQVGGVTIRQGI